jgi:adenosine/AMP kinase
MNYYNYIVKNVEDLNNIIINNNDKNIFYIELESTSSDFSKMENQFIDSLNYIIQFIEKQSDGSSFIIRIYQMFEPQTITIIQRFCSYFEKVKILTLNHLCLIDI